MSSGDAGQRLPPATRCCSAPTLAAPRWHGPQPGYGLQLGFPLNAAKGHSRARAQLDRPGGASDTSSSNIWLGYYLMDLRGQGPWDCSRMSPWL